MKFDEKDNAERLAIAREILAEIKKVVPIITPLISHAPVEMSNPVKEINLFKDSLNEIVAGKGAFSKELQKDLFAGIKNLNDECIRLQKDGVRALKKVAPSLEANYKDLPYEKKEEYMKDAKHLAYNFGNAADVLYALGQEIFVSGLFGESKSLQNAPFVPKKLLFIGVATEALERINDITSDPMAGKKLPSTPMAGHSGFSVSVEVPTIHSFKRTLLNSAKTGAPLNKEEVEDFHKATRSFSGTFKTAISNTALTKREINGICKKIDDAFDEVVENLKSSGIVVETQKSQSKGR